MNQPALPAPLVIPGTIREHPMNAEMTNKRYAVKTGIDAEDEKPRAWFIYDIENGGWYAPGSECADWPPYSGPPTGGENQ